MACIDTLGVTVLTVNKIILFRGNSSSFIFNSIKSQTKLENKILTATEPSRYVHFTMIHV